MKKIFIEMKNTCVSYKTVIIVSVRQRLTIYVTLKYQTILRRVTWSKELRLNKYTYSNKVIELIRYIQMYV